MVRLTLYTTEYRLALLQAAKSSHLLFIFLYHHTSSPATLKMTHFTDWVDHCTPGTDWQSSLLHLLAGVLFI